MPLTNAAAGFIGASVTLVLVIIFMILMVILVRQCLAFLAKRNTIRAQMEQQRQHREQLQRRRGSITEPVPATFDWHHSIRIAGTPPPTYHEAKKLPAFDDAIVANKKEKLLPEDSSDPTTPSKVESNGKAHSFDDDGENPVIRGDQEESEQVTIEIPVAIEGGMNGASSNQNSTNATHPSSPDHIVLDAERLSDETRTTFTTGYTEFGTTTPM